MGKRRLIVEKKARCIDKDYMRGKQAGAVAWRISLGRCRADAADMFGDFIAVETEGFGSRLT